MSKLILVGPEMESAVAQSSASQAEHGSESPVLPPACAAPRGPIPENLAEGFGDPLTLLNSRDWLQRAVEAKGATVDGAGCGCGQADLSIVLEGHRFNISIRPL